MRAFIAIDLPDDIRQALARKMEELRRALGHADLPKSKRDSSIRWSRPEGIHLTLKFLGEITETQVDRITGALSALEPFEKFCIQVKGFGFFPTAARPRVFWAGIDAPPDLIQLAERIEDKMEGLGFAHEDREYNPHLTLARITNPRPEPTLRALVEEQKKLSLGRFEVLDYFLFESKLSPEGSKYRRLVQFPQLGRAINGVKNNQSETSKSKD